MLQIRKLTSDTDIIQVNFIAEDKEDVETMVDLLSCYASDYFHCFVDLSEIKIPVKKDVILTLDKDNETINLNYPE